jgi:cobalt/nickel transport system permease protein
LHHVVLEGWSRRDSPLHRRDARAKILATILVLVFMATAGAVDARFAAFYGLLLLSGALTAGVPVAGLAARAALVLPFAACFAGISALSGDAERAAALLVKSVYSAITVLLLAATTPMPDLLAGGERLGAPRLLVAVVQFLYRYLFVLSETAQHMRLAAASRGGWRWSAAGGAAAVLFASAYNRAEGIHRAMLSRGFTGHLTPGGAMRFGGSDAALLTAIAALLASARLAWSL